LLIFLLVLVLAGAWSYGKYARLKPPLISLLNTARRLEAMNGDRQSIFAQLKQEGVGSLLQDAAQAELDLRALRRELRLILWLCPRLSWLPRIGENLAAVPHLLDMGIELVSAGWWAGYGLEPLADVALESSVGSDLLVQSLPRLALARPYLLEAGDALARAQTARDAFAQAELLPQIDKRMAQLDDYLPLARWGIQAMLAAPELLGENGSRTYLLIAQNNQELRPTGGFISGVGELRVERGEILSVELRDSYAIDQPGALAHPLPPEPLARYMWAGALLLRDANWSPDFPTSAEVIASLYQQAQNAPLLDGVIAADLNAVKLLVDALAPIRVPGYGAPLTGDNVMDILQQYWAAPVGAGTIEQQKTSDWWTHRKDIMGDLLGAILIRVQSDPGALDLVGLAQAVKICMEQKYILTYSRNADLAAMAAENGWDGSVQEGTGDYLMVIDANLGFNKVDASIERRIEYFVDLRQSPPQAEVILTYRNKSRDHGDLCRHEDLRDQTEYKVRSYEELTEGCYWDYVRIYTPLGSQLDLVEGAEDDVDVGVEFGKSVWGAFFGLPPGQEKRLRFRYTLPGGMLAKTRTYSLLVQKQPGVTDASLRVTCLLGDIGPGFVMPAEAKLDAGRVSLDMNLRMDIQVLVGREPSGRSWLPLSLALVGLLAMLGGVGLRIYTARAAK
jgi:hypothetical protein